MNSPDFFNYCSIKYIYFWMSFDLFFHFINQDVVIRGMNYFLSVDLIHIPYQEPILLQLQLSIIQLQFLFQNIAWSHALENQMYSHVGKKCRDSHLHELQKRMYRLAWRKGMGELEKWKYQPSVSSYQQRGWKGQMSSRAKQVSPGMGSSNKYPSWMDLPSFSPFTKPTFLTCFMFSLSWELYIFFILPHLWPSLFSFCQG